MNMSHGHVMSWYQVISLVREKQKYFLASMFTPVFGPLCMCFTVCSWFVLYSTTHFKCVTHMASKKSWLKEALNQLPPYIVCLIPSKTLCCRPWDPNKTASLSKSSDHQNKTSREQVNTLVNIVLQKWHGVPLQLSQWAMSLIQAVIF